MRDEYTDMVDKTTNRNKCIRVCYLLGTLKKLNCTVFRKGWTKVLGKVRWITKAGVSSYIPLS